MQVDVNVKVRKGENDTSYWILDIRSDVSGFF